MCEICGGYIVVLVRQTKSANQTFEIPLHIKAIDFLLCLTKVQYRHNNAIVIQVVFHYKAAFSSVKIYGAT